MPHSNPLPTPISNAVFSTVLFEVEKCGVFLISLNVHSIKKLSLVSMCNKKQYKLKAEFSFQCSLEALKLN